MRLVLISDTHGSENELVVPDGDVLIHAGDYSAQGTIQDIVRFNAWLGDLPHKCKLIISGNHDEYADVAGREFTRNIFSNAIYLENELIEIEGYKFWGSPITPEFGHWAFMKKRGDEIASVWEQIPENIDVLITHGPPLNILDKNAQGEHCGCYDLYYRTKKIVPTIHCYGHIHEAYGVQEIDGIQFINCSSMNENYDIVNKPLVVEI